MKRDSTRPEGMKAYVYDRYGGPEVVRLDEVARPVPRRDEILVKIFATTVTAADWRVRTLDVPKGFGPLVRLAIGVRRPRSPIMGTEFAGIVEAVGDAVTRYKPGDAVFGSTGGKMGAHAQYRAIPEAAAIAPKPAALSYEQAAALPFGGTTALHFLRKARLKKGDEILVVGASGNVGTAIVQIARHLGARVSGVTSARNLELVSSLGAEEVIDYTQEDALATDRTYDVIADTVGASTYARSKHALREGGRYLAIAGGIPDLLSALAAPLRGSRRVVAGVATESAEDLRELAALATTGALRPVIDRTYEFSQMIEAHAYVETRRKRGSVVIRVAHEPTP